MDVSGMTEEEQLRAAMELSLQDTGGPGAGAGGAWVPAPAAATAPPPPPPAPGAPRQFHGKSAQDPPPKVQLSSGAGAARPQQLGQPLQVDSAEVAQLLKLLFGSAPEVQDLERWLAVGFQFSPNPDLGWGLWQQHGGPCGVFAPVQAYIMKNLLFGAGDSPEQQRLERPLGIGGANHEDERRALLSHALATVLYQATPGSSYVVCQASPPAVPADLPEAERGAAGASMVLSAMASGSGGLELTGRRVGAISDAQLLLEEAASSWLSGPCGVLSFVCSAMLTRTCSTVCEDMDDTDTPLISRFGHCSQELVNLMLIGEAVTNVFDGSRWLGDDPSSGLLLKGVDGDRVGLPPVGFLSELEPMRYLSVGTLYKNPEYPIWVLGSPTHYTLIFSAQKRDAQLSKASQLEQRAKKVFGDSSIDDGGLAMASSLGKMLDDLGIGREHLPSAQSELDRESVVLWQDFHVWARRHFGVTDASGSGSSTLRLFLYDGQDPPGPSLRSVALETSDIDPRLAGGSDGDTFSATLHTRWPNAIVEVSPLAGACLAGAGGQPGSADMTVSI